jgi:ribonuclease HI
VVLEKHGYVGHGPGMTNNVAEYCGCSAVPEEIAKHEGDAIVSGDSELVINQMKDTKRAKKGAYLPYFQQARTRLEFVGRDRVKFQWIPREQNQRADSLSKRALSDRGIQPFRRKKFELN